MGHDKQNYDRRISFRHPISVRFFTRLGHNIQAMFVVWILILRISEMPVLVSSLGYLALIHLSPFSFNSSVRRPLHKVGRNGVLVLGVSAAVRNRFNGIEQSSHTHHWTIIGGGLFERCISFSFVVLPAWEERRRFHQHVDNR